MIRSTTNGTLKSYRFNLQRSTYMTNKARDAVLTQRQFNSFAEDPTAAARSFQLRRSYAKTDSQHAVNESVVGKYDVAWSTLQTVVDDVTGKTEDAALQQILRGENQATAGGRTALGESLTELANSIVQAMNCTYSDNFVFAGADGLNVPFTWETLESGERQLKYRGVTVDSTEQADINRLDYMVDTEKKYVDIGLGLEEDDNNEVVASSAYNVALQGVYYLGHGSDEEGDPKNIASMIDRMGRLLKKCDYNDGSFATQEDEEEFYRLAKKFEHAAAELSDKHVELDAQASFLQSNQEQLETNSYTLQEQITAIEDVDLAEAITAYSWAQYCYNAALKVGNSILSESLMDYMSV